MIVVDANVPLSACHPRGDQHEPCRSWVEEAFSGATPVGLPWLTHWVFLRIAIDPRAFERPLTMKEAEAIVIARFPQVRTVDPTRTWHHDDDELDLVRGEPAEKLSESRLFH